MKKLLLASTTTLLFLGLTQTVQAAPFNANHYRETAQNFAAIHMASSLYEMQNANPSNNTMEAATQAMLNSFKRTVQITQKNIQKCYATPSSDKEKCSYQDNAYAAIWGVAQQNFQAQLGMNIDSYTLNNQTKKWNNTPTNANKISGIQKNAINAYQNLMVEMQSGGSNSPLTNQIMQQAQQILQTLN